MTDQSDLIMTRYGPVLKIFSNGTIADNTWVDPHRLSISPTTYIARLRDAIALIRDGKVILPNLNVDEIVKNWKLFRMEQKGEMVVFRLREQPKDPVVADPQMGTAILIPDELSIIHAAAKMLSGRYIKGPVRIEGVLSLQRRTLLESEFDIAFDVRDTFTLML